MYAVIVSGGKQFRVIEGQTLKLEKISADVGDTIDFEHVLMIADGDQVKVGVPYVEGGKVVGSVVSHGRHDKIIILKFKRRKHHMKRMGHRQHYTEVKITQIVN
jgi:large subunit ribosomal protein L21